MTGLGRAGLKRAGMNGVQRRGKWAQRRWTQRLGQQMFSTTAGLSLWTGLSATTLSVIPQPAIAQAFPPCPGPAAGEYLLLARSDTAAERERIASVLPAVNPVLVCRYNEEVVVRAGGFEDLEAANAWALYLRDIEGIETVVAQPTAATAPAPAQGEYQPQALATGYAVLVDYENQLEVAGTAATTLNQPVGLAVYRQQPYLLAAHTADATTAAAILQQLTTAGLNAILVESQQVVRLLEAVGVD